MGAISFADVQALLNQPADQGLMVSGYANTSNVDGFRSHWRARLKTETREIEQLFANDPRARLDFEQNLQAIRRTLEDPETRKSRGVAVFSAAQRGFFRTVMFDFPVEDCLVVHPQPYLVPLLQVLLSQRHYLAVRIGSGHAEFYAADAPGQVVKELEAIEGEVPKRQHSAGERWGKEQATIARHREDRIAHFQKELVEKLAGMWERQPFAGIVFLGEHELVAHVRQRMPARLAGRIVAEAPGPGRQVALADEIRQILHAAIQKHEEGFLQELHARLHERRAVATGPQEVLDVVQSGKIGPKGFGTLILGHDSGEAVARCTACRFLDAAMPEVCPRCQAPCVEANLWEELLLFAARHALVVHFVLTDALLDRAGGIAALLARAED